MVGTGKGDVRQVPEVARSGHALSPVVLCPSILAPGPLSAQ